MVPSPTISIGSTLISPARIFTSEIITPLMIRTVRIVVAIAPDASGDSVAPISGKTSADGSVGSRVVESRLALGMGSAGVRGAKVLAGELAARYEWVASVA